MTALERIKSCHEIFTKCSQDRLLTTIGSSQNNNMTQKLVTN